MRATKRSLAGLANVPACAMVARALLRIDRTYA